MNLPWIFPEIPTGKREIKENDFKIKRNNEIIIINRISMKSNFLKSLKNI